MLFQTQKASFVRPLASIMEDLSSTQKVCFVELGEANPPLPAKDHSTNPEFQVSSCTKTLFPAFSLKGKDKQLFLDFVSQMLQWLPEERKTAKELLEHPWLVL